MERKMSEYERGEATEYELIDEEVEEKEKTTQKNKKWFRVQSSNTKTNL